MLKVIVLAVLAVAEAKVQQDVASQQIITFKQKTGKPVGVMTASAGAPIEYKEATNTLNSPLLFNEYFMDSLTHLVRERIPERLVHAKAGGAFGYFEVTHDITDICKAKMFSQIGKKTPVAVRFSPVVVERGGIDTSRDARGFAIKFYTEDGNFDIAGFNTPIYVYKDPLLFTAFVRTQKRNPATNLMDVNMLWDYLTLRPEGLYMFLLVFGDRGIPDGYRHMPGFGIHTYQVVNKHGASTFIRWHFQPDAGIKNLRSEEASRIAAQDPDYATRDLYNAIANGNPPSWKVSIQVLTLEDVKKAGFDVFDVTKALPLDDYPLKPVGRFVLNKNPINYFAEIEQLAFSPTNLVPGILGAPDKVFEARRMAYRDAQYYRLGANFNRIPVNCPIQTQALAYNRDGRPPLKENDRDIPNYFPNTFNGPQPYKDPKRPQLIEIYQDLPNNFDQATELYTQEMTKDERSRLVANILFSLGGAAKNLQDRAVKLFTVIHPDLGGRIQKGLLANRTQYYDEDYDY
ncbi:catalase-like [Cydia strobilella]|uniref:catalase-like n=1 Tax=Cydia strobilella TaxID=1100964 RepID=UPI003006F9B0